MATKQKKQYSPEEKATYKRLKREEAKERLDEALDALLDQEGWMRWLRMRTAFRNYSWHNTLMIALQSKDWPEAPSHITGARTWEKSFNRHPAKGTKALRIFAPVMITKTDSDKKPVLDDKGKPIKFPAWYKLVPVFDVSQTEGDPMPEAPEVDRLKGEDQMDILIDVYTYAEKHGLTIKFDDDQPTNENLRIAMTQIVGQQIKLMALSESEKVIEFLSDDEREIIAEAVTFIVLGEMGYDTSSESVPTIATLAADVLLQEEFKANGKTIHRVMDRLTYYIDREAKVLEEGLSI